MEYDRIDADRLGDYAWTVGFFSKYDRQAQGHIGIGERSF